MNTRSIRTVSSHADIPLEWLTIVEQSFPAQWLRFSRWGYASVNTLHVLGVALLVGAIVPLDLRLLGGWASLPLKPLASLLQHVALGGLLLALPSGMLLFAIRATEYAGQPLFLVKLSLVALALFNALVFKIAFSPTRHPILSRFAAGTSLVLWPTVLVSGRFLGFVAD